MTTGDAEARPYNKGGALKNGALSIRIQLELRWALELLARKQFRSVTGVVQVALINYMGDEVMDLSRATYHHDDMERIRLLAKHAPELVSFDERELVASAKDEAAMEKSNV